MIPPQDTTSLVNLLDLFAEGACCLHSPQRRSERYFCAETTDKRTNTCGGAPLSSHEHLPRVPVRFDVRVGSWESRGRTLCCELGESLAPVVCR
jgi:hypothetical protein